MRVLIAIVVVLLLMAITALAVLWLLPPGRAATPASGPAPGQWQRVAGAVTIGVGAFAGRDEGARAASDLARGAGWL